MRSVKWEEQKIEEAELFIKESILEIDGYLAELGPLINRETRRMLERKSIYLKKQQSIFVKARSEAEKIIEQIKTSETK